MAKKKVIVNKKCYAVSKDGKCCAIESYQCANCYSQLKLGMRFCYKCGNSLDWGRSVIDEADRRTDGN